MLGILAFFEDKAQGNDKEPLEFLRTETTNMSRLVSPVQEIWTDFSKGYLNPACVDGDDMTMRQQ